MVSYFELTSIPKFLNPSIPKFKYCIQCNFELVNKNRANVRFFIDMFFHLK